MSTFPLLSSEGRWGPLTVRNRMFAAPLNTLYPAELEVARYARQARGGVGLIVSGSLPVTTAFESYPPAQFTIASDDGVDLLRRVTDAVHAEGAVIAAQLKAGDGRVGRAADGGAPWAPGAVPNASRRNPQECRPLSADQIDTLVAAHADAAARALTAGFDAIDLPMNSGYLLDQFLTAAWNPRDDEFGGDPARRLVVPLRVLDAVRGVVRDGVPISVRLAMSHRAPGLRDFAESADIARALEAAGVDVIVVDEGSFESPDMLFPPYYLGEVPYLTGVAVANEAVRTPLAVAGSMTAPSGEDLLSQGLVSFVGFGRPLVADPDLPGKVLRDRPDDIRPCIRCNAMCVANLFGSKEPLNCSVNPEAGYEDGARALTPAETPRHILVVGAGPAGLEAARVAAVRGHRVEVYDRADQLGGLLTLAATPEFKEQLSAMVDWWDTQLEELGVPVHLGREITPDSPELQDADAIILATGSSVAIPPIPGAEDPAVLDVVEWHAGAETGRRVIVCGGGLSGSDAALELAETGRKEVTIVEAADEIAHDMLFVNKIALARRLERVGVRIMTNTAVSSISPTSVTVSGPDGEQTLQADTVVLALGTHPDRELADAIADWPDVVEVGDCVEPGMVGAAVHAGYLAAREL